MSIYVVALGGTPRAGSSTEKALRVALAAAEAEGAETLLLGGDDLDLPLYVERAERGEKAARLVREIARADGILVASPGYHGTVSGLVKNALDYVEDLRTDARPYFHGRAVGCVAVAYGWQASVATLGTLRAITHALRGWPTPLGAALNASQPLFDEAGRCTDDAARGQLETVARQVVEFAKLKRAAG